MDYSYVDALELVSVIMYDSCRTSVIPSCITEEFFELSGLTLKKLHLINVLLPRKYKQFFSEEEFQLFLAYLESNGSVNSRYIYEEHTSDKRYFLDGESLDPKKLLDEGWVPELYHFHEPDVQTFLVEMVDRLTPDDTWKFFHNGITADEFLRKQRVWLRASTQLQDDNCALAMMFTYREMLWSTKHLRTDMKMFQQTNYLIGSETEDNVLVVGEKKYRIYGKSNIEQVNGVAFPVSRYANSPETGKYYSNPGKNFFGTFYYLEPESTTYLISDKVLYARTKTSAAKMISIPDTEFAEWATEIRDEQMESKKFRDYEEGNVRKGYLYTPIQAKEELGFKGFRDDPYSITQYPVYMGALTGEPSDLYASEDEYDQHLCIEMKRQGIEVACLTEMIGAFGVVAEILDSRSRIESFSSLVYT